LYTFLSFARNQSRISATMAGSMVVKISWDFTGKGLGWAGSQIPTPQVGNHIFRIIGAKSFAFLFN
jgi:hypothetical protein